MNLIEISVYEVVESHDRENASERLYYACIEPSFHLSVYTFRCVFGTVKTDDRREWSVNGICV